MSEIGKKLRELRNSRGITLRGLAKEVGIHFSSISNIENGKEGCGEGTLTKLAEALGADVDLLRGSSRPPDDALSCARQHRGRNTNRGH